MVKSVQCADSELNELRAEHHWRVRNWIAGVEQDAESSVRIEESKNDGSGNDEAGDDTPPQLSAVVVVSLCRDLLRLAIDGMNFAAPAKKRPVEAAPMTSRQCESCFESVSRAFGRGAALSAVHSHCHE